MSTSNSRNFPGRDQLDELPLQLTVHVPPEWEDRNGHVNVQYYLTLYELGGWKVLEEIGVDDAWFKRHDFSMFDLEHHLHFLAEIRVGDCVSTYNRVLGRSEKRFHGMYFMVNETRGRLAGVLEYMTSGVDMKTRRTAPFPAELASGITLLFEKHRRLSWPAPVCGVMTL